MDDSDSPDELINRRPHSRRTVASWDISDDSDDSDSGEEEEEDDDDALEGGEGNQEEDVEDEEEDAEVDDGVLGETSAAIAAMSSDEDADKCPICLNSFSSQPVATPENCQHYFCLDCILAWAKNANSCPVDRIAFSCIYLRKCYGGKVQKMITVQKPVMGNEDVIVDLDLDQTNCEVCQGSDREDRLLLCDGCDAGYHMECLTPPLDTVPVEEWFCPECVANSNNSEQENGTLSLSSTAHPTTSRTQSRAAGPTRAIARTQHSERVRANVNRHRITQARTPQLAPTYLMESTWLDDTINAVVAGLNTAVYVRDLTPRAPSRRRRRTGTRRKKAHSGKGKKVSSKVKRRRKVRRTKSRKTLVEKRVATPQSRIANSLGLSKDKNCSLPTVCRPSEHTLSSMRADIGAASLSIHGDPFDLDPFIDCDKDEHEERVTSLLQAKRRGISHSAFRSHQPVARPVVASLSRLGVDIPQTGGVVEAAPVPDLLGSILSGQSLLLMDSSGVVINRDGSLKATESTSLSALKPGLRRSSSTEESSAQIQAGIAPSLGEPLSNHHNSDLLGSSHSTLIRPISQSSSQIPSAVNHIQPVQHHDLLPRSHLRLQQPRPTFGVHGASREAAYPSRHPDQDSKNKTPLPKSQPMKTPIKPMWVDVSILPKIPKIKRESSDVTKHGAFGTNKSSSNSPTRNNTSGIPETALISFAGDKNRKEQVVPQHSNTDRQAQRQGAGSSQAFSNSFSFSSSTDSQLSNSSVSSSSSAISFRINSSGNSWHSRRLNLPSSSASGSSTKNDTREKTEMRKRDKQMLLASTTTVSKKEELSNIYDPFNPTMSDSSTSDNEGESMGSSSHPLNAVSGPVFFGDVAQSNKKKVRVKVETQENAVSQEEPRIANLQTLPQVASCSSGVFKLKKESVLVDTKTDNQTALSGMKVKRETGLAGSGENTICGHSVKNCLSLETPDTIFLPAHHSLDHIKAEEESGQKKIDFSGSGSHSFKRKLKEEIKSDSRSPPGDLGHEKHNSSTVPSKQQPSSSSTSESDRGKTKDHHVSSQGDQRKKMDRERASRRSRSQEKRTRSLSESSLSSSSERTQKKRKRKSSSSSREHSRRKHPKRQSKERTDDRRRADNRRVRSRSRSRSRGRSKDQRRGRSRSKSVSTSRSRSRSKERRKEHTQSQHHKLESRLKDKRRPRSRSSSRERRKAQALSKSLQKTSGPSKDLKKESIVSQSSLKEENMTEVKKDVSESPIATKVKKKSDREDSLATSTGIKKDVKKEVQQSVDMFEHSPITKHIKKEDTPSLIICYEGIRKEPVDTELCQTFKTEGLVKEAVDIELCQTIKTEEICETNKIEVQPMLLELPFTSHHTTGSHQDQDAPNKVPVDNANTVGLKVPFKSESNEDVTMYVDLDNLDCVKPENTGDIGSNVKQEDIRQEGKAEAEQVPAPLGAKAKIQGKRVTWNIQEPDGSQTDKSASKLALYKLKLKQEAARRPPSTVQTTSQSQDTSGPGSLSDSSKGDGAALLTAHSSSQEYLKKLHMQERAVEEVKLAIKPFYQRRDINKEEYKEILRKAVQKVCHSKSGEINPVKVGNLVKAYVEKYKHARKQKKSESKPTKMADC
ncbi:PHD and RING finger domain-containing protein 1 isoform X2 [Dunckerocampus dactyliophorus]|uniref:PHD and RING finger domain-containing protein 1 isoform X2 n=1 Tax=Dunckerocampus dactyliophorus TaxID=161453 RepID=UPI002405D73B|nr:PHD and RING finger domain-containing protein 1 isoform X2 [Dunckerocampus dactyliophorus]